MKCTNCGNEIEEGQLYCSVCEETVQIVPDYNPLEDILAAQVKGAIDEATQRAEQQERQKIQKMERRKREKRKQIEQKKAQKRKRKIKKLMMLGIFIVLLITLSVVGYFNSYAGHINRGNRFLKQNEYRRAIEPFETALSKNEKKEQAYIGLSSAYIGLDELDNAEQMFMTAASQQPRNVPIHRAFIQFYLNSNQEEKISELLSGSDSVITRELSEFVSEVPVFSLSDEVLYDEVQELSLQSDDEIYYTLDDTKPTISSTKYQEALLLQEGENIIRAIAVNPKGVPSLEVRKVYNIEFPTKEAPAVSPSTGQYDTDTMIEITVPDGYTAYYTTDNSIPTAASQQYTGPMQMPEGNTLLSVVLVNNNNGRVSNMTKRNYILVKD